MIINNYNNKILVSEKDFNIGTNLSVNITEKKPDPELTKPKEKETEHKVMPSHKTGKTGTTVSINTGEITHEEEKTALILGITSVFSIWWFFIK